MGKESWSGRIGFILATTGSAVGIGSIWKFPYEVGSNGGCSFILFYLAGLVLVVVPLMFTEFALGRRGHGDAIASIAVVSAASGGASSWYLVGALGVLTGFLILSFYSVIGGWTLHYAVSTAMQGLAGADAEAVRLRYAAMLASPATMAAYHAVFMASTGLIVARGIASGIELASKILMPMLFVLMCLLTAYALVEGDVHTTLQFLLKVDARHVTARSALEALGLGFFSIGVGLGLMITYAAYAGEQIDLRQAAIWSVAADTFISLLAGLAVFPIVFARGLDPDSGPGLVFLTLPLAFAQMPFGSLAAVVFFLLLFVAALASAISMLELIVAATMRALQWRRPAATAAAAAACFAAGIVTVLSFNVWADWLPLASVRGLERATAFDLLDLLTSNLLLPASGLALSLFAGWVVPPDMLPAALGMGRRGGSALRLILRYLAPCAIVAVSVLSVVQ